LRSVSSGDALYALPFITSRKSRALGLVACQKFTALDCALTLDGPKDKPIYSEVVFRGAACPGCRLAGCEPDVG
jgi:hypothetical protein